MNSVDCRHLLYMCGLMQHSAQGTGASRASQGPCLGVVRVQLTWQVLQAHVMDDLVIATLQEGGVDGAEGLEPLTGQPRGECHGVLLCDADVEDAVVEARVESVKAGATTHGRVDPDDARVPLRLRDQSVRKDIGE